MTDKNPKIESIKSLIQGIGSTISIIAPHNKVESKGEFLEKVNVRLKNLHKDDSLYRRYDFNHPADVADCWQDTGRFLNWAIGEYQGEQEENFKDGR